MPRKSSFKNKQKVEESVEEPEQPVEEVKKIALKKKERKQRKKRGKKEEKKAEKKEESKPEEKNIYEDIVSFGSEIMGDASLADFSYEAKEIKKEKKGKSMLSKIVSAPLKVVTAPLKIVSKISPFKKEKTPEPKQEEIEKVNDEPLPEPVKSDKPTKDSIMAKLAALQASRSITIQPKAKKPTPTPKPVMKELVITSDEKKIEQLKEKPVPKSESRKVIDHRKTYKLFLDLEQEDEVCEIDFNSDRRPDLTLYRMSFNKNKKTLNCSYFCGEKWTINKRITLKQLSNVITFKPSAHVMHLQVHGVTSQAVKRRNAGLPINFATWDCKTLRIV